MESKSVGPLKISLEVYQYLVHRNCYTLCTPCVKIMRTAIKPKLLRHSVGFKPTCDSCGKTIEFFYMKYRIGKTFEDKPLPPDLGRVSHESLNT